MKNTILSYKKKRTLLVFLGIVLLASLFMLPYLGSVNLFDSNEVNYAESSREMILTGDYMNVQIDFQPFPEKPPLFFIHAGFLSTVLLRNLIPCLDTAESLRDPSGEESLC